ncbi:Flp pilus assembly protein CpaB [Ochrobactrum sp. Marseille-Q0166]|uniref:Flp pilus assembly protein CpaB n=1 Tax=Ochrobactrum sp. Marseille-Q0166 TaxID=2761105 RepID=UPI001655E787|nr:Flp pilus assembly protein CpaB [Ochrobactrum sp. Marseille-Q0166]
MRLQRGTLLAFAGIAAGVTGFLAYAQKDDAIVATEQKAETQKDVDVLVTVKSINAGEKLDGAITWETRPVTSVGSNAILRNDEPAAIADISRLSAKRQLSKGAELRHEDHIGAEQRALSLQIQPDKRAMAVKVEVDTSAGGFILPNDRVDVIIGRLRAEPNNKNIANYNGLPRVVTETILHDIRVLAVDQTASSNPEEEPAIIGKTATLELTEKQAEIMVAAQQVAQTIALSLRSSIDKDTKTGSPSSDANYLVYSPGPTGGVRLITSSKIVEVGIRR